ncbi:MAG: chorismate mutase [Candidatus Nanopelagicales bacterium]
MTVRAIRGATSLQADDAAEMREAVVELLRAMLERNGMTTDDLVSVLFTATPDLHSAFPAAAARELDMADVPLMCAVELDVPGAMARVVRVLAHVQSGLPRAAICHVYQRGTESLRPDLHRER